MRILITGASSGIGAATADALLARGHRVHAAARRIDSMEELGRAGAVLHVCDLADPASIDALAAGILAEGEGLDALVNNAGFGVFGSVEETPLEDARAQFEVKLFGLARLTRAFLPGMRERCRGRIVNVSSVGGRVHTPLGAWYHASEHALEGWSDCLRVELRPHGVGVVVVQPGAVRTGFHERFIEGLLRRSGDGPYADFARRMAVSTRRASESPRATPPEAVAEVIVRALEAPRPRSRYLCGHLARPVVWLRRLAGDRLYDWIVERFT